MCQTLAIACCEAENTGRHVQASVQAYLLTPTCFVGMSERQNALSRFDLMRTAKCTPLNCTERQPQPGNTGHSLYPTQFEGSKYKADSSSVLSQEALCKVPAGQCNFSNAQITFWGVGHAIHCGSPRTTHSLLSTGHVLPAKAEILEGDGKVLAKLF